MTNTSNSQESLISEGERVVGLPPWVRCVLALSAIAVLGAAITLMWAYIQDPENSASPQALQLGNLVLAAFAVLILALVPWHKLGLRIRKIGAIEFDRVVSTQAKEYAEEFSEQRARIVELERLVHGMDEISGLSKHFASQTLRPLVLDFLNRFQPTAFSPLRIRQWGSRQSGFESLGDYEQGMIRRVLQDLVAEGLVATRVSRLGNTLFKVADE